MAVESNRDAILQWVKRMGYENTVADQGVDIDQAILSVVTDVVDRAMGDPGKAARFLEAVYGWAANDKLVWHLEMVRKNLAPAQVRAVMAWVLRTGIRFPAREKDFLLFYDETALLRKGRVVSLEPSLARAIVEGENGTKSPVLAELVRANMTQGLEPPNARILRV